LRDRTGAERGGGGSASNQTRGRNAGADSGAGAQLRAAGHEPAGDPRPEDAEAQQGERREDDRHGVVDGGTLSAEASREL